jgi:hypothetical protein
MTTPRFQKKTDKVWSDEEGMKLPFDRLKKSEKLRETIAEKLYKQALKANETLEKLKAEMIAQCQAVMDQTYADHNQNPALSKGNFTWYNFDRSLKVVTKINERIDFDQTLIELCQNKLNEFLTETVETKDDFIKQFVTDAFSQAKGGLDAKKVMSLLKYRSRINHPIFQEALKLLEESIRHPDSKRYFQMYVRDSEGAYQNIDLNFSNI